MPYLSTGTTSVAPHTLSKRDGNGGLSAAYLGSGDSGAVLLAGGLDEEPPIAQQPGGSVLVLFDGENLRLVLRFRLHSGAARYLLFPLE